MNKNIKKKESVITILTTTYNRPKELYNLFLSLKNQIDTNFEWLVIDDGSTQSYQNEKNLFAKDIHGFKITFLTKKNGGKHRAINFALPLIKTKLMMIIDDDDYLIPTCTKEVSIYSKKFILKNNNIRSIVFERASDDGVTPLAKLPKKIDFGKRYEYMIENRIYGDFTDIFDVESIREFKLPEFKGEKFISEGLLYYEFGKKYNSVFIKKILSIGGYHNDGLTKKVHQLMAKNIEGSLYETSIFLKSDLPFHFKIKKSILYGYLKQNKREKLYTAIKNAPTKISKLLCPLGYLVAFIRK